MSGKENYSRFGAIVRAIEIGFELTSIEELGDLLRTNLPSSQIIRNLQLDELFPQTSPSILANAISRAARGYSGEYEIPTLSYAGLLSEKEADQRELILKQQAGQIATRNQTGIHNPDTRKQVTENRGQVYWDEEKIEALQELLNDENFVFTDGARRGSPKHAKISKALSEAFGTEISPRSVRSAYNYYIVGS